MKKTSIEADFLAARAKTHVTILNATGWRQGVINRESLGGDSVFFYVLDHETRWIWCCSFPRDAFYGVLQQFGGRDQATSISACQQMIAGCAAGNGLNPDKEDALGISLAVYIAITKTYQLSERATRANHFVVMRYGSTETLRPFAMGGPPRHILPFDVIDESMHKVMAIDLENHPEWFVAP